MHTHSNFEAHGLGHFVGCCGLRSFDVVVYVLRLIQDEAPEINLKYRRWIAGRGVAKMFVVTCSPVLILEGGP